MVNPSSPTEPSTRNLWHVRIDPAQGQADAEGQRLAADAADLSLPGPWRIAASRGFLIEGDLTIGDLRHAAEAVLVDMVAETFNIRLIATGGPEAKCPE